MESDTQAAYQLSCMEVWGGNGKIAREVELPGLAGWVHSAPTGTSSEGGDICYFSVCNAGFLSRVALADVSGHGAVVSSVAATLLSLMRKHINTWDQSTFMQDLDREFRQGIKDGQYATAVVLGFFRQTGQLLYTSAGHYSLLWYHAAEENWGWMDENSLLAQTEGKDPPIGSIPGTHYRQIAFKLAPADLLVLYTDGLLEAMDEAHHGLSSKQLLEMAANLPVDSPVAAGKALLGAVSAFRQGTPAIDDQTLVVLQCRTGQSVRHAEGEAQAVYLAHTCAGYGDFLTALPAQGNRMLAEAKQESSR